MAGYKNILVAIDLAGDIDPIMKRAKQAQDQGAALTVVHVLEPAFFYYGMEPAMGVLPAEFEADLVKHAEGQLADACTKYGIDTKHQRLLRGHAPTEILALAEEGGCDLIVVGSHGRHGWRLILGSTANAVLHGAGCDVLAVRVGKQQD